jgi:hypothetical protein
VVRGEGGMKGDVVRFVSVLRFGKRELVRDVHLGVFAHVRNSRNGNTKVTRRAPEI